MIHHVISTDVFECFSGVQYTLLINQPYPFRAGASPNYAAMSLYVFLYLPNIIGKVHQLQVVLIIINLLNKQ